MNAKLNKFYCDLDKIKNQIAALEKRPSNLQQNEINGETIYNYLACFDKYYDEFTDAEKKGFMHSFVERIDIFEQKQDDVKLLKSIEFKFPVRLDGGYVKNLCLTDKKTLETVVSLVRK